MIVPPSSLESKKGSNSYYLFTKLRRMTFDFLRVLQALTTFILLNWEFCQKKKPVDVVKTNESLLKLAEG